MRRDSNPVRESSLLRGHYHALFVEVVVVEVIPLAGVKCVSKFLNPYDNFFFATPQFADPKEINEMPIN